ncbi:hypothetical protein K490DRAFT_59471 [Saccharata proteae CBS 121410]|uniref:Uncharacterized protein n=1 Tax=Saccharata proteae CBS 121410 TaxID=1314787 RepID=A0A9P4HPX4_9PEZI|nr:hypothetical protein K490DRAFT_59471 [Saccharata proteae CBS 121410]
MAHSAEAMQLSERDLQKIIFPTCFCNICLAVMYVEPISGTPRRPSHPTGQKHSSHQKRPVDVVHHTVTIHHRRQASTHARNQSIAFAPATASSATHSHATQSLHRPETYIPHADAPHHAPQQLSTQHSAHRPPPSPSRAARPLPTRA